MVIIAILYWIIFIWGVEKDRHNNDLVINRFTFRVLNLIKVYYIKIGLISINLLTLGYRYFIFRITIGLCKLGKH
jgi:hypothetical protein